MKLKKVITCLALTFGLVISGQSYAGNSMESQMNKMQEHWRMIMNEKDTGKRKKMLIEHRHMMDEIEKSSNMPGNHMQDEHHMQGMSGDHMNMMNMMDMHRSMMHMMEH